MKKTLIATAVMATLLIGSAQAETVLYGSIRYDYQNSKDEIGSSLSNNIKHRTSNLTDQGSRIGLKGGEDLGNGVQLVFHLEWGFDGMEGGSNGKGFKNRLAYIGLATDYGTVVAGRLDNPFKVTIVDDSVADDFNSFGETGAMRAVVSQFDGGIYADYGTLSDDGIWTNKGYGVNNHFEDMTFGLDRVSNAIAYLSPTWNGFSFNAAMIMDNDLGGVYTNKKHVDVFTFNAKYEHESGLYAKVGYIQGNTVGNKSHTFTAMSKAISGASRKTRAWGGQIGYRTEQFGLSAAYADAKLKTINYSEPVSGSSIIGDFQRKDKAKGWDIGASYAFGDNYASSVRIAYGETRYTSEDHVSATIIGIAASEHNIIKPKDKIWAVGFEQKLSERTRVWAEYQRIKQSGSHSRNTVNDGTSISSANQGFNDKRDTFALGIRHDF